MAQMEHSCADCGWIGFDNEILLVCPMCSSSNISNWPDEDFDTGKDNEEENRVPLFI